MNSPLHILEKYGFFHFFPPLSLRCLPFFVPSSPHVLGIKELGHPESKFEQTNSHVETVLPNKLQALSLPRGCLFMLFVSSLWWASLYYMEWKASDQMTSWGRMKVEAAFLFSELFKRMKRVGSNLLRAQREFNKSGKNHIILGSLSVTGCDEWSWDKRMMKMQYITLK